MGNVKAIKVSWDLLIIAELFVFQFDFGLKDRGPGKKDYKKSVYEHEKFY